MTMISICPPTAARDAPRESGPRSWRGSEPARGPTCCAPRRRFAVIERAATPSEKTARPHIVSPLRDEVKRALRCADVRPRRHGCRAVRTARSRRGILPSTHLAREGRMTVTIGRRELLAALGGAAAAWPLTARAQQTKVPMIGYIDAGSPEPAAHLVSAFRGGLGETGFAEGRNVAIEFRWAHNNNARLPELAADLVRRRVAVIVAPQSTAAVMEAKAATRTIPIVFGTGSDPVQAGLVTSLNRPGGNLTGITFMNVEITAKRFGLLHELLPNATRFGVLINPKNSVIAETIAKDATTAASAMGRQVEIVKASTNRDIESAFSVLKENSVTG